VAERLKRLVERYLGSEMLQTAAFDILEGHRDHACSPTNECGWCGYGETLCKYEAAEEVFDGLGAWRQRLQSGKPGGGAVCVGCPGCESDGPHACAISLCYGEPCVFTNIRDRDCGKCEEVRV
jgi:hypothetical protein